MDPSLLLNLGFGLLSASGRDPGHPNVGTALQGSLNNYYAQKEAQQRLGLGNLQMQQQVQEFPLRIDYLKALGQKLHTFNNDPAVGQQVQGLLSSTPGAPVTGPSPMSPASLMSPDRSNSAVAPSLPPQSLPQSPAVGMPARDNPMDLMRLGAFGGALGMPGAQGLQELGKTQLQYDPGLTTQMEAAKSAVAVTQQQIEQALAQGNRPLAEALYNGKFQEDLGLLKIASNSGTVTRIDPRTGGLSTLSPNEGVQTVNGQASLIPGMAIALQQKNAAEAVGRAAGETIEVTDSAGNKYQIPKSVVVGSARPPTGGMAPPSGAPTSGGMPGIPGGVQSSLGPARAEMLKGNAAAALETNKGFQDQAENGQQMVSQVQALRAAAAQFPPGQFAPARAAMLNFLNSSGLITADEKKQLGSYQEGQKIAIQLQAAATKQLGSREAAQVFQYMGKSLPNLTLSENGLQKVAGWQEGIARYNIARAQHANQLAQNNDATGVNQTRDTFIKQSNPLFYVMASSRPDIRQELLDSMGGQKARFIQQWNAAANSGLAPRPNEYEAQ